MIYVILVIIISGVVGGLTNYLTDLKDSKTEKKDLKEIITGLTKYLTDLKDATTEKKDSKGLISLFHNVLRSIIASFVVPLFLNTISSNLVSLLFDNPFKPEMLIFAGFCLLASLYSQYFLSGMFSKMMEKIKEVDNKAMKEIEKVDNKAMKEIEKVDNKAMKEIKNVDDEITYQKENADEFPEKTSDDQEIERIPNYIKIKKILSYLTDDQNKENTFKVVKAFYGKNYWSRSIAGIAKQIGISDEETRKIINNLRDKKIVIQTKSKDTTEWWRIDHKYLNNVSSS